MQALFGAQRPHLKNIRVEGPSWLPTKLPNITGVNETDVYPIGFNASNTTDHDRALQCQAASAEAYAESLRQGAKPAYNLAQDRSHIEHLLAQVLELNDDVQSQLDPIFGLEKNASDVNTTNMLKWLEQFHEENHTNNSPKKFKLPYSALPRIGSPTLKTKDADRLLSLLEAHASTRTYGGAHLGKNSIHSEWWIRAPLTEELRSGLEKLEKDKENFFKDMLASDAATQRGSLADSMIKDLVHTLTTSIAVKGTDILSYELAPRIAASMVSALEPKLTDDLNRLLTESVSEALGNSLTHTMGRTLIALLPTYLTQILAGSLTGVLGRGLTHTLTPSLTHTLTFFDHRDHGDGHARHERMKEALYYAEAYGRYYSDYFSDLYAGYMNDLDFEKKKFSLWMYHGEKPDKYKPTDKMSFKDKRDAIENPASASPIRYFNQPEKRENSQWSSMHRMMSANMLTAREAAFDAAKAATASTGSRSVVTRKLLSHISLLQGHIYADEILYVDLKACNIYLADL